MELSIRFSRAFPGFSVDACKVQGLMDNACMCIIRGEDASEAARCLASACTQLPLKIATCRSANEFVATLETVRHPVCLLMERFEDLDLNKRQLALIEDAIRHHLTKWRRLNIHVLLIISTTLQVSLEFMADSVITLPPLPTCRGTLISSLLPEQLPIDPTCTRAALLTMLEEFTTYWSRSDILKLVRHSCMLALAADKPLNCFHVGEAHRLLFQPSNTAHQAPLLAEVSKSHRCCILPDDSLDAFEGSNEAVAKLHAASDAQGVKVVSIAGVPGSGKSMLARLIVARAAPDLKIEFVKASDVLSAVVGESEKRLANLLRGARALIIEDADQLWPSDVDEVTGAIQRLLPTLLHALDHLVNQNNCLIVMTSREASLLHCRVLKRVTCRVVLDSSLGWDSRKRLFAKWTGGRDDIATAVASATEGLTGAACARLMREAGIKAITRYVIDGGAEAALSLEDFI